MARARATIGVAAVVAVILTGCGQRDGTCLNRVEGTCSIEYVQVACERPGEQWTWEGSKKGLAHCKALGFTRAQKDGNPMSQRDIDVATEKGLVFFK
jgi:hypothetical protein